MNKLTTTLAGLAVLASASVLPASAQTFTNSGPFTFTYSPTTFTVSDIAADFFQPNPSSTPIAGTLSLFGGTSTNGVLFTDTTLKFVSGTFSDTETGITTFVNSGGGTVDLISGATPLTKIVLYPGTPTLPSPAVPEASTVISFGALLALGGLAVLRRKSVVKNAA